MTQLLPFGMFWAKNVEVYQLMLKRFLQMCSFLISEKISAMEKQIANLAGLVHHALSMGSEDPRLTEAPGFVTLNSCTF